MSKTYPCLWDGCADPVLSPPSPSRDSFCSDEHFGLYQAREERAKAVRYPRTCYAPGCEVVLGIFGVACSPEHLGAVEARLPDARAARAAQKVAA